MRVVRSIRALLSVPSMRWRIGSAAVATLGAVALGVALLVAGQGSSPVLSSTLTADVAAVPMDDSCGTSPIPTDTSAGSPTDTSTETGAPTPTDTSTDTSSPTGTPADTSSPTDTSTDTSGPTDTPS